MKLEIKNLKYQYEENSRFVIDDISFVIDKPGWISILGHNGSGKSTLAKLIMGIIEPKAGSIFIDDLEVEEDNLYEIRKKIGIVYQNPDNQFVATSVEDDIAFGLENLCVSHDEMQPIIDKCLDAVSMSDYKDRAPSDLSGGQKQRVAIAGILAIDPEIFIFDEATSMLDPKGRKDLIEIAKTLKERGKTIIMITHNMDEALLSDRCIVLKRGKIIKDDETINVLTDYDTLRSTRLEMPSSLYVYHELVSKNYKNKEVLNLLWELASKK